MDRLRSWQTYYDALQDLMVDGEIQLPVIPKDVKQNGHIFYIKVKNREVRNELISYLKHNGVSSVFHYVPLHSSDMGKRCGYFDEEDIYTTSESERILRLPMYYGLKQEDILYTVQCMKKFYNINRIPQLTGYEAMG
ncbi:dTDP-4-amino-4,6-dideoxygalactose transaminase [compost metagenome]